MSGKLSIIAMCLVLASAQVCRLVVPQAVPGHIHCSLSPEVLCPASTFSPLLALQTQLGFAPAPAPGPEALSLASAREPANQILTGPIDPVSTPVLAALVPVAGSIRTDVDTGVSQVESGIDDIKADLPGIEASFKGRKLLSASIQVADQHTRIACFVLRTHMHSTVCCSQSTLLQRLHKWHEDPSQQHKACHFMSAQNCLVA